MLKLRRETSPMEYSLIKPNGTEMKFYLLEMAEMYQTIYGGRILFRGRPMLKLVDKLAA